MKPPKPNHKKINPSQLRKYFKNLDVEKYDSYFTTNNNFKIMFPVDSEIKVNGVHYYNLFFGDILIVHISNKNSSQIRDKERNLMVTLDIREEDFETIFPNNQMNLSNTDNIHVFIYNNDVYPDFPKEMALKGITLPDEKEGGGVIVKHP